jgi:hypothetical protein
MPNSDRKLGGAVELKVRSGISQNRRSLFAGENAAAVEKRRDADCNNAQHHVDCHLFLLVSSPFAGVRLLIPNFPNMTMTGCRESSRRELSQREGFAGARQAFANACRSLVRVADRVLESCANCSLVRVSYAACLKIKQKKQRAINTLITWRN